MNIFFTNIDDHKLRLANAIFAAVLVHVMFFYYISLNNNIIISSNLNQQVDNLLQLNLTKLKIIKKEQIIEQQDQQNILNKTTDNVKNNIVSKQSSYIPTTTEVKLKGDRIPPQYPSRALKLKQEGQVLVKVFLAEDGSQIKQEIINSSGHILLDRAALQAIKKWSFLPYKLEGKNSKTYIQIPIEFKIS